MASSPAVKFLQDVLKTLHNSKGFVTWFHKVRIISAGDGDCTCEMTIDDEHLNLNRTIHGGCVCTLVDIVSNMALSTAPNNPTGVTVDLGASIMTPGRKGEDIVIIAKASKIGRTLAFHTVDIKRKIDDVLIATGSHTQYITGQRDINNA